MRGATVLGSRASHDCIGVLVADSNQTQSQLLSSALRRQPGIRVARCGSELSQCLQALQADHADIVLLTDVVSDQDGLVETLRGLHGSYPKLGIVLVLDSFDRNLVVRAMRAGARGLFCRASQPFRALCRCISVVQEGQFWASAEQVSYIVDALKSNLSPRVVNAKGEKLLTPREEQVVNQVVEGIGNRRIGQLLGIKENTVKKSLLRIYDKLGVSNRVELVLYALTHWAPERTGPTPTEQPPAATPSAADNSEPARSVRLSTRGSSC